MGLKTFNKTTQKTELIFIASFTILLFIFCFFLVRYYYKNGLPYYDSVGSYWNMFSIMNVTQNEGFLKGLSLASKFSLSWLQSFFAVFASYFLSRTPQDLISINFFLLLISQFVIYFTARQSGLGKFKSFFLSFMPQLPGALFSWYGGYIDMRRDAQMFSLLTSLYFFSWFYLHKPTVKRAVVLGVLAGLSQWSRGNALPYILLVLFSVFAVYIFNNSDKRKITGIFCILRIPFFVFLTIAVPFYYFVGESIYVKYFFGSWGLGSSRLDATIWFFKTIPLLIFGTSKKSFLIGLVFLLILFLLFYIFIRLKKIEFRFLRSKNNESMKFLYSGMILIILIYLLNVIVLGIGRIGGFIPYFPILIGFFGVIVFLINKIDFGLNNLNKKQIKIFYIVIPILLILLNITRIYCSMPKYSTEDVACIARIVESNKHFFTGGDFAFLWVDHPNFRDFNYYLTQKGMKPIYAGSLLMKGVDIEMPPDRSLSIEDQQNNFSQGLKTRRYIVVAEDTSFYDREDEFFFIFKHGKKVIEELLDDPNIKVVGEFKFQDKDFLILENSKFIRENTVS